jgi:hypothetical protein
VDDEVAELFLAEKPVSAEALGAGVRRATVALKLQPVFMGSAFKNKGGQLLVGWDVGDGLSLVRAMCPKPNHVRWRPDAPSPWAAATSVWGMPRRALAFAPSWRGAQRRSFPPSHPHPLT